MDLRTSDVHAGDNIVKLSLTKTLCATFLISMSFLIETETQIKWEYPPFF